MTERASIRDLPDLLAAEQRRSRRQRGPTKARQLREATAATARSPWPGRCLLDVAGEPAPEGSTKTVPRKGGGPPVILHDSEKLEPWRRAIAATAAQWRMAEGQPELYDGALRMRVEFYVPRPPSVSRTKRPWPTVPIDESKLIRAVEDALTGLVYTDDSRIVEHLARKVYADLRPPGALIELVSDWQPWAW